MKAPSILVIEDNPITRKLVRVTLTSEGYRVLEAPDARTALELLGDRLPDLILQDLLLPDMDGFELLKRMRNTPAGAGVPILAFSGFLSKLDEARSLQLGFSGFLFKPVEPSRLLAAIRSYLAPAGASAQEGGPSKRILVVDDDPIQRKLLSLHLTRSGFQVLTAEDGVDGLKQARAARPDAIVSDVLMPNLDGFEFCLEVRRDAQLAHLPVVLTSLVYVEEEDRKMARDVGANSFVLRGTDIAELKNVLLKSMKEPAPRPLATAESLTADHLRRITRTLERQALMNTGLARRCSLQSAELSVLGALSGLFMESFEVRRVLDEALARMLDASAFSMGAVYLLEPDGTISLTSQLGCSREATSRLPDFFGQIELLHRSLAQGKPLALSSAELSLDGAGPILPEIQASCLLITPLILGQDRQGVLVMASSHKQPEDLLDFGRALSSHLSQAVGLARALQKLAVSEQKYHHLVEGLDAIVWEADAATLRPSFVSRRAEQILGYPVEQWLAEPDFLAGHCHVDDRARLLELRTPAAAEGKDHDFEYRAIAADGRVVWLRNIVRQVGNGDGQPARLRGVMVDVSAQKRAAEALRQSEASLAHAQRIAHLGNWDCDIERNELRWSDEVYRIFGLTPQSFDATADAFFACVHPEDRAAVRQVFDESRAAGTHYSIDHRIVRPDGQERLVHEEAEILREEQGRAIRMVGTVQDITERKKLQEQLHQAQKMEAIGRLAGGVAHDFNNMLMVITGYSELLLDQLDADDQRTRAAREIQKAAERASALTRQLLAFSRKQVLQPRVLDLNSVVKDTEAMLRRVIGEDVKLVALLGPGLHPVKADPGQIEQVIMNLAVNARDAMPEGGSLVIETANVELDQQYSRQHSGVEPGFYLMLAVSDTGTGMDEETQTHIFEPFFTTKEPGKGTGLGLATVYGIVKQAGGHIWVYSERNHGTVFKIYLPRFGGPDQAVHPPEQEAECGGGVETILLVEDEEVVRSLVRSCLAGCGYTVLEAADGPQALRLARRHKGPLHLLLTDVVLPQVSGRRLAERLSRLRSGIRVLYMSGYTDDAILHHGVLEANTAFLQKPFTSNALRRKVREVLDEVAPKPH